MMVDMLKGNPVKQLKPVNTDDYRLKDDSQEWSNLIKVVENIQNFVHDSKVKIDGGSVATRGLEDQLTRYKDEWVDHRKDIEELK